MSRNPASSPRRASSPAQGPTRTGVLKKIATAIGAVLVALVISAYGIFLVIGEHTDFGRERVVWYTQACGVGLVIVAGLLIACAFAYLGVWRAKRNVDIEKYNQRSFGMAALCVIALYVGFRSISQGLPAFRDLKEGTTTVTVTSCTYEQGSHRRSRGRTVYDNYFTMTLADGTLHTTTIETDQPASIQTMGGTYEVLYQACKVQSGNASMTLDVYEHSWIIVDARIG